MIQQDLFQTATSSQQDIPANPSPSLGSAKARRMTATSGRLSLKLLHRNDPLFAFSKMFMVISTWDSTRCFLTWKPKTTPAGRLLFQLAVSMPHTKETDSGLLHTPTATANQMAPSMNSRWWPTPAAANAQQGAKSPELYHHCKKTGQSMITLVDEVRMWPTPQASDNRDRGHRGMPAIQRREAKGKQLNLSMVVSETSGSLNPEWVTWLMGYPRGWTDLTDGSESQKTSQE